jgi:hypothetical protein
MKKLSYWLATAALALTAAAHGFALVAVLDQFARLPFYHTLMVVAAAADAGAVLAAWRMWGRGGAAFAALRSRVSAGGSFRFSWRAPRFARAPSDEAARPSLAQHAREPSAREISEAMRKVHSVAWGFPNRRRTA